MQCRKILGAVVVVIVREFDVPIQSEHIPTKVVTAESNRAYKLLGWSSTFYMDFISLGKLTTTKKDKFDF